MAAIFEGRKSDSPYIDRIWQGYFEEDYMPICPADTRWNLLFLKEHGKIKVSVEGAVSQSITKLEAQDSEFLVIQFKPGAYMPDYIAGSLINTDIVLDNTSSQTFWLNSSTWELPSYENVEAFIDRLVKNDSLICDPIVTATLQNKPLSISERTIRRRFLQITGLTPKTIELIQRARQAALLLEQGVSIMDVVFQTGYADQSHMTRSLRHFFGQTPTMITTPDQEKLCPICSRQNQFIDLCLWCTDDEQKEINHAENHISYSRNTRWINSRFKRRNGLDRL